MLDRVAEEVFDDAAANALYRSIPRGEPATPFVLYEWKTGG